jgi:hypothetical protein
MSNLSKAPVPSAARETAILALPRWLTRRTVVIVLGSLWCIDGLLQLQPSQFTTDFSTSLEMNAMAQPSAIAFADLRFGRFIAPHVGLWNTAFALFQLTLGLLILLPRTRRTGLALSIPWAIGVWVFGEGLGSVATGFAMLPTGAPGAALLYAILASALVASDGAERCHCFLPLLRGAWITILISSIALQLSSSVSLSLKLRANFHELIDGEPRLLASIDQQMARATATHGTGATVGFVLLECALLLALVTPLRARRGTLPLALVMLLAFWIFGENFAGIFSGSANDVGTAPLLAVLALAIFPHVRPHPPRVLTPDESTGRKERTVSEPSFARRAHSPVRDLRGNGPPTPVRLRHPRRRRTRVSHRSATGRGGARLVRPRQHLDERPDAGDGANSNSGRGAREAVDRHSESASFRRTQ